MRIGQVERTSWGNCPNICALSGPCGFVVWLFASQNDLPDRAPDQRKCGRKANHAGGYLCRVLRVWTPLCIRLDHDAYHQAPGCLGPELAGSGQDIGQERRFPYCNREHPIDTGIRAHGCNGTAS